MAKFRKKKFKIYPDPENPFWFCTVELWKSTEQITKDYYNRNEEAEDDYKIAGLFTQIFCTKIEKGSKKAKRTGEFGRILFGVDDLSAEYVVHECGHAAHEYCRRRRKNKYDTRKRTTTVTDHEEVFCYALGKMSDQVLAKLFTLGYGFSAK